MLFNSYEFIFAFLPITLIGFFLLARFAGKLVAAIWLTCASLVFYGWWDPRYLALLLVSITVNYAIGLRIARLRLRQPRGAKHWLVGGLVFDLGVLAYFKYTGFLWLNFEALTGIGGQTPDIALPLGISFFTFTQIAFLVDAYLGIAKEYRPVNYALFVTYFPHLIAGPVLHHKEMMPQFGHESVYRFDWTNFAVGLTLFAIGLAKKTLLADGMAPYVAPAFDAAAAGQPQGALPSWGGALAYTFQLYFDFSGYTDMALGLSMMIGIRLPLNFNSPYKATSIIDFWRRWHITLSRFLRDYLYIPLGGSRHGTPRRYVNLMTTMVLGGLWHGASWTFVAWGGLHGLFLLVNHAWRASGIGPIIAAAFPRPLRVAAAVGLTFGLTVVAWVFFRASDFASAWMLLKGMAGLHGVGLEAAGPMRGQINRTVLCLLIVWACPNSQQILARFRPALEMSADVALPQRWWMWRPNTAWILFIAFLTAGSVLSLSEISPFIYFNF